MWWKAFLAAFGLLFAAELGDKTQLVIIALAGRYSLRTVFLAAAAAFAVLNALAVSVGAALYGFLPEAVIKYGVAALFILFGSVTLLAREEDEEMREKTRTRNPFLSLFLLISLMELGDKTQLSLLALTAKYSYPLLVWLGGTLALWATSFLGALLGAALARVIPFSWMRRISGVVFIAFGIASLFW